MSSPSTTPESLALPTLKRLRPTGPRRGIGLRAATSFAVVMYEGPRAVHCHAVELSASGVVIDRGRELSERERSASIKLDLLMPGGRGVRALARVVRRIRPAVYALKFVMISDVDRLTLMEHLDSQHLDALRLLEEIERVA